MTVVCLINASLTNLSRCNKNYALKYTYLCVSISILCAISFVFHGLHVLFVLFSSCFQCIVVQCFFVFLPYDHLFLLGSIHIVKALVDANIISYLIS